MFLALGTDSLSEGKTELSFGRRLKTLASSPTIVFLLQNSNKSCTQDEIID